VQHDLPIDLQATLSCNIECRHNSVDELQAAGHNATDARNLGDG
jgi:hypothetical protein